MPNVELIADAQGGQWVVVVAGFMLSAWLLMRRSLRRRSPTAPAKAKAENKQQYTRGYGLLDAPDQVIRWEVSMHETARELKAELDSKMMALQALVRIAREETERLEAAIARSEKTALPSQSAGASGGALGGDPGDGEARSDTPR